MSFGVDIGHCFVEQGSWKPIECPWASSAYCCQLRKPVEIIKYEDICCTHQQYADQHWVSLAIIQGYLRFVIVIFLCLMGWMGWFYASTYMIKDIRGPRHLSAKRLLKSKMPHKSPIAATKAPMNLNIRGSNGTGKKLASSDARKPKRKGGNHKSDDTGTATNNHHNKRTHSPKANKSPREPTNSRNLLGLN